MAGVNLKSLVGKLNPTCRTALESAAGLCLSRTNYNVEIEHWFLKILEQPGTDLAALLRYYEVNPDKFKQDLTRSIDRLKTGNSRPPALSANTVELAREALLASTIEFNSSNIRSGHLLFALIASDTLSRLVDSVSPELEKITADSLRRELLDVTEETMEGSGMAGAAEALGDAAGGGAGEPGGKTGKPAGPSKTPALDQFTTDVTAKASAGKIDPVLGRDPEIRQIIDILTRRRQNNPILTGEAGVGKTTVVEGFALRIAAGDVPDVLKNVSVRELDMGLLQAGAGMKGEFENRLKSVIAEVKSSPQPIILFIDEAHSMIGAGGSAGQGDAANLLKPALARGELRTIAATTWAEYKKYFEKDAALTRRFQVVKIEEPSEAIGIQIMRGLAEVLENHHNVRILDEAVRDSVRLSMRYITGRQLPDKSVSLLDTACARVAIGQAATPPQIEDCRRRVDQIKLAIEIYEREEAVGADYGEELAELRIELEQLEQELAALEERWEKERELVNRIRDIRDQLEGRNGKAKANGAAPAGDAASGKAGAANGGIGGAGSGSGDGGGAGGGGVATQERVETKTEVEAGPAGAAGAASDASVDELKAQLRELNQELEVMQGESPLMQVCVDSRTVAEVVSAWTGIPVGRMVSDEINIVLNLRDHLEKRIVGQSHALEAIAQRIRTSRAKLSDPRKPIGVFFMVGTSGVGKTETAIALADLLYGGEQNMTVINMSEFKEEHKVSLLMGSPPGYVGYGEGGVLTEAVRRKPYSVLLLDEMEKAHPGVQDIFYQVFDKGTMKDGEGRDIDFKNTVIIMTSNAASDLVTSLCADPETRPDPDALAEALHPELVKTFKPAFLGRVTIVPFFPLTDDVMKKIVELQMGRVARRVRENYNASFEYAPDLVDHIVERCREVQTGARNVDHILSGTLLPEMSSEFLGYLAEGKMVSKVRIGLEDGRFAYELS
jgi:type VI secretion system protein VasG